MCLSWGAEFIDWVSVPAIVHRLGPADVHRLDPANIHRLGSPSNSCSQTAFQRPNVHRLGSPPHNVHKMGSPPLIFTDWVPHPLMFTKWVPHPANVHILGSSSNSCSQTGFPTQLMFTDWVLGSLCRCVDGQVHLLH